MFSVRNVFTIFFIFGHSGYISGCSTNCESCDSITEQCQQCLDGFWLENNYICRQCPWTCVECTSSTQCTKCKANYWGTNCQWTCYRNCDGNGCDDLTSICHKCKSGYYGLYCTYNCRLCKSQLCDRHRCSHGCIDGYYELISGDTILCQKCNQNCAVCESYYYCSECKRGFYRYVYNISNGIPQASCYTCNTKCEECPDSSTCTVCKPGTYGKYCENSCSLLNCYRCTGSGGTDRCTECKTGYKLDGNECVPCVNINGLCLDECTSGYWGEYCNKTCPKGCASCSQINGYCDVCHLNKYGEFCQFICSEHCADDGSMRHVCSNKTGKCRLGCKNGYSGDRCNIAPTTLSSDISRITTTTKSVEKSDITETFVESSEGQTVLIVGTAAGGSALIISILVIVIVCVVRRRKKQSKEDPQECHVDDRQSETVTVYNQYTAGTAGNVYEKLDGDTRDDQHQYSVCSQNAVETDGSVYQGLDGDTHDDQHHYSGLGRPTD